MKKIRLTCGREVDVSGLMESLALIVKFGFGLDAGNTKNSYVLIGLLTDLLSAKDARIAELEAESFTHAYCRNCKAIMEIHREPIVNVGTSGRFVGGDVVCSFCRSVAACVYRPVTR